MNLPNTWSGLVLSCLAFALLATVVPLAQANPNPNDPAWRYERLKENAGRSPLPQPREVFAEPLAFETEVELTPDVPASGIVAWEDAYRYVGGEAITVEGTIVDTYQIQDIVCRLQFARYEDDPRAFYIALFKEGYDGLDTPAERFYLGKKLRVTGPVTLHRGQPNLEVRDLRAIEIIDP